MTHPSKPAAAWRIAHTESSLGWGGQERRILAELTGFRDRGCEVHLWAPPEARLAGFASELGIPVHPLHCDRVRMPGTILRLAGWLRANRIQVLNPHSSRDGWIAGIAGRMAGTPLIIRSRHFDVPITSPWLSRLSYHSLVDHLVTTSPRITDNLRQTFGLSEDAVSTIPTGVDLQTFTPGGPAATFDFAPSKGGTPLLGMIGVFRRAKGHPVLLEAMQSLRAQGLDCQCVMVGEGPMLGATQERVREMGLAAHVHFLGERNDIPGILRLLDVLVMPSLHEGIPQVGLQALACGTPLVGSNVGGIGVIVGNDERGRLVRAGDPAALAAAIRETLTDRPATEAKSRLGRRYVEAGHGLDTMLDRLDTLYRSRLGGPEVPTNKKSVP